MRKNLLNSLFLMLFISVQVVIAQDRFVTGTITGKEDGLPLPGVSVKVTGTQIGTSTNAEGKFSLTVPSGNNRLQFIYIGYSSQTVTIPSSNVLNVALSTDSRVLGEVVVTALGISRAKKSLGYSATSVNAEEITRTSPVSMFDGLQGKIAGANISSQSGAPGASTKVILRGYASLGGQNQPLYVIDGVPMNNSTFNSTDNKSGTDPNTRSTDFGNNANDINPNDIESISVLKGAGSSSLYGSRAANGVILITTKKGKKGKLSVEVNSAATFSSILMLPQLQNTYGQGWNGVFNPIENGSWGPRLNGEDRLWGNVVNNSQLVKPYAAQENNLRDFYDVGNEINNSISVSGGGDRSTFHFSYGNIGSNGIVPTDADSYNRNNFGLRGSTNYGNFTASASLNYINRGAKFVATGQGSNTGATLYQELLQIPRDHSIVDSKDYENTFYNINNFNTPYAQNPYFVLNENGNDFKSERLFGNLSLDYKFTPRFSTSLRVGTDITDGRLQDWQAIGRPEVGSPNISRQADIGGVREESSFQRELNTDLMLNFNSPIATDVTFDGLIGGNYNQRNARRLTSIVEGLTIPEFYSLSNSTSPPTATTFYSKRRLMGAYAQANFAYRNYLYLQLNARNDWSSTLPTGKNSFFYPSANVGFVLSDAFTNLSNSAISFAKVRASIGQTGNDAAPYLVNSVLVAGDVLLGSGNIKFPLSGISAFEVDDQIGNNTLQPEITTEYEFGADVRFFQSRLGLDVAYYDKITTDQILEVPIAASSGYTTLITNFGKIQNKGIELTLTASPLKTKNLNWDLTYTYTRNRNEVLELPAGLDQVVLNSGYDVDFVAIKGKPIGVYRGPTEMVNPQGQIVVNPENGLPLQADEKVEYGNSQRDFVMGLNNRFSYKNWALGFSFDYRQGGLFWSYTSQLNYFVGNAKRTLYNDRNPYILPNSVIESLDENDNVIKDAAGNTVYLENKTPINYSDVTTYWSAGDNTQSTSRNTVFDRTSLKMRDITLSYMLPKSLTNRIKADNVSLTAYGRNLFIWLPGSNRLVDPEVSTYNNDLRGELGEFAAGPSVRSYGLSLRASF